jgi:hypothetical protein
LRTFQTLVIGVLASLVIGLPAPAQEADEAHEFFFTRGIYSDTGDDDWGGRWAVDYPKADLQFLIALKRLSTVHAFDSDNALELDDPALRKYPFLFMVIDDFWGTWAWENLVREMRRVFPDREIVDVPMEHPVFHAFYDVTEILQVPNVYQGSMYASGGPTHEYDGYVPHVRGIFDEDGRLVVLINWNTDLGDAWEWADDPNYPLKFSTFAFEMGINFVIYGMTY